MAALKTITYFICQGPRVIHNREAAEGVRKSKRLCDNESFGGLKLIKISPDEVVKPEVSNVAEELPQEETGREQGVTVKEGHGNETTVDNEREAVNDATHHAGHHVHAEQFSQDGRGQGKHCEVRLVKVKLDELRLQESLELGLEKEENYEEDPALEILVKEYARVSLTIFEITLSLSVDLMVTYRRR